MENGLWLLMAIALAYGCALAAGPLLRLRTGLAVAAICFFVPAVLACPLLIPADKIVYRAVSALFSTDLMFRMVDFFRRQRGLGNATGFRDYCRFLIPFPILLVVLADHRRLLYHGSAWSDVVRVFGGVVGIAAGFLLLEAVSTIVSIRTCFLLDHLTKVMIFVLTIESVSHFLLGLERLAGRDTTPIVRHAFLSRTVSEFWERYNGRVHRWLYENVFRPSGGRRAPIRAVWLVFLVSALLHELMFGMATSRFDGYQFAFFMLQAPAVLGSRPLERLANRGGIGGKALAHGVTIAWMAGTSVLFFHGVHKVFPFVYVSESWLP
jgi:hypothetical protein